MFRFLGAALLAASLVASSGAGAEEHGGGIIVVTGEGMIETTPDIATVSLGVETEADTATEALSANSEAMAAVMAAVSGAGIAPEDVQTSQINLNPVWSGPPPGQEMGRPEISGYSAVNMVTLRVRDIGALGGVLDALGRAGANRINGIAFSVAEPGPQHDAARREAVRDARARAELYAEAAGVELGALLELREAGGPEGPIMLRAQAAEMAMDVPVSPGAVQVSARVEVTFAIAD